MSIRKGFTLLEFIVVLIIVGLVGATVIPQVAQASRYDKLTSLATDLQMIRSQLDLYKVQHNGLLPGQSTPGGVVDLDDFVIGLTTKGLDGYGPYIDKIPSNPFISDEAIGRGSISYDDSIETSCPGDDSSGWWINAAGRFHANTSDHRNL